jgi:hypothetical protein
MISSRRFMGDFGRGAQPGASARIVALLAPRRRVSADSRFHVLGSPFPPPQSYGETSPKRFARRRACSRSAGNSRSRARHSRGEVSP